MKLKGKAVASAPASIANLGPGFDRVGISFPCDSLWDTVSVRIVSEPTGISLAPESVFLGTPIQPEQNMAAFAVKTTLDYLLPDWREEIAGVEVAVFKGVPPGSGLGSSAASAVAGVVCAAALLKKKRELRIGEAIMLSGQAEALASGTPHYDNAAASLLGGFVSVRNDGNGRFGVKRLSELPSWGVSVFVPDISKPDTKFARDLLPREDGFWADVRRQAETSAAEILDAIRNRDLWRLAYIVGSDEFVTPKRLDFYGAEVYRKAIFFAKSAAKYIGEEAAVGLSGAGPSLFVIASDVSRAFMFTTAMMPAFGKSRIYTCQMQSAGAKLVSLEEV